MLTIKGIFKGGEIKLHQEVKFDKQVDVLVTFLDDVEAKTKKPAGKKVYSFKASRNLLKDYKGSLSDAVVEERRSQL
jgi:hypothetical protein